LKGILESKFVKKRKYVKVFPSWKKNQAMVILVNVLKLFFSS
jgi:hypothetical protein